MICVTTFCKIPIEAQVPGADPNAQGPVRLHFLHTRRADTVPKCLFHYNIYFGYKYIEMIDYLKFPYCTLQCIKNHS